MNRRILRIALPAIASNITVPLLGLCDTTIAGHLGASSFIGAIAVGTMMINVIFWCFGFLRMGTTGLTAQAYGRENKEEQRRVFSRAFLLGFGAGLVILLFHSPLRDLVIGIIDPAAEVRAPAVTYFDIVIWGAPAMLATMAVSGWFLGMQSSFYPMLIAVITNVINIGMSLVFVFVVHQGFAGTAMGTLLANWCGLLLALLLAYRFNGRRIPFCRICEAVSLQGMSRFFRVNGDIFFRSFCIMAVSLGVSSIGARLGADTLAVNAVMMQFFIMFSYFMDGFAFAGEALTGKAVGAGDVLLLSRTVRSLLFWGAAMAFCFTIIYVTAYGPVAGFITDNSAVLRLLDDYRWFLFVLPLLTVSAFIFDGIYIGMTATRAMLVVTLVAGLLFYAVCFIRIGNGAIALALPDNYRLWTAFLSYLLVRGLGLALLYRRIAFRKR